MLGLGSGLSFSSQIKQCKFAKIVYDTNQTSGSGIIITNIFDGITASADDTFSVSTDMYLTGSGGTFDDGADDIGLKWQMGGGTAFDSAIAQNTVVKVTGTSAALSGGYADNLVMQFTTAADFPDADAAVYIGNLVVTLKDSGGNVKGTYVPNFASTGDVSMIAGYSLEGSITVTKGNCIP